MKARDFLLVGIGGAVGGGLRHGITLIPGANYALTILAINVLGAFALPIVGEYLLTRLRASQALRLAVLTGAIASFTTFSAITGEMVARFHAGQSLWATGFLAANFALGLAAAALGLHLAGRWLRRLPKDPA